MTNVFVSHAVADSSFAYAIGGWLSEAGHQVFLDFDSETGIELGSDWEHSLDNHLSWADVMVSIVTSDYVSSPWCAAEVGIARHRGNRVIPVIAELGIRHPLLDSLQGIDAVSDLGVARERLIRSIPTIRGRGSRLKAANPYPGLRSLEMDERELYFGRARERERICSMLRSSDGSLDSSILIVTGPSGCGKSSLVKAGVMSALDAEQDWHVLPAIRPGRYPRQELARAISLYSARRGTHVSADEVLSRLASSRPDISVWEVLDKSGHGSPRMRIMIFVDQFEELLTQADASERRDFILDLVSIATPSVRIVATLRPEFIDTILTAGEFSIVRLHLFPIRVLDQSSLRLIIEGPAKIAGIEVSEALVARILDDAVSGSALPLVAYTLHQIAADVERGEVLSERRYVECGGVQGALRHQADMALHESMRMSGSSSSRILTLLLRLVTVDEHGTPIRGRIPVLGLDGSDRTIYNEFLSRRLLSTETFNGEAFITVAHEAFLNEWSPLAGAIVDVRGDLLLISSIENRAYEWERDGRDPFHLLYGVRLEAIDAFLRSEEEGASRLSVLALAYVTESTRRRRADLTRERRRKEAVVAVTAACITLLVACLAVFGVVYFSTYSQLDANLLSRATAVAHVGPGAVEQFVKFPIEYTGWSDVRVAVMYSNGSYATASSSEPPPVGQAELDVAKGMISQSIRTAYLYDVPYRVVAVDAGAGRAMVIGQDLRATQTFLRNAIAAIAVTVITALIVIGSASRLVGRRQSSARPDAPG